MFCFNIRTSRLVVAKVTTNWDLLFHESLDLLNMRIIQLVRKQSGNPLRNLCRSVRKKKLL